MKNLDQKARAYALKNALAHNGKAVQGAVIASLFNGGLKKSEMKKYARKITEIISEINKLSVEQQKKDYENLKKLVHERKVREGLPELPGARKGKVIMRFSPSPSGPMHIGHIATACISFLYVRKYGGKFYVRIEDTNPENIYKPAYKMLADESKWLFDGIAKIQIQSNNIKNYYKYIEKLIKKNSTYVCTCSADKFKEFISAKRDCPCRKLKIRENLERWKKMLGKNKGKDNYGPGQAVVRFKAKNLMKHKNPAFRDFPLARICLTKHALQKNKYRVWPLMNLAVVVDDIETKMTHIIRAKDHRDNAQKQKMIYNALGLVEKYPWTAFLGRFKFKDMDLSATKMRHAIEQGKYSGWDDPRLPTLTSLKKKGYKPQAFWKFAEQVGLSEVDKVMDKKEYFTLLDSFNREAGK